jgi:DnaJ-class molecular chaperone
MEEIHQAFLKLSEYFHPDKNSDPDAKIYFNDITMAYNTLSNKESRGEYDEYMQTCYKYATMWIHEQIEDEVERERLEKIQERRKKRLLR